MMMRTDSRGIWQVARNVAMLLVSIMLAVACASEGDSRAKQGAASGAAIGAGIGLLVGVISGDSDVAARAVAVGAASGAIRGGYEGWRQDQDDERTRQITQAIRESNAANQQATLDAEARQREELTRFLGVWQLSGWIEEPGQGRLNVTAQINGNVHMTYFVELAYIDFKVDGYDGQIWGTSTLGYDSDSGFGLSTRFNTMPDALEVSGGRFDSGSRTFTFSDAQGQTLIQFQTPDRYTVTTMFGGNTVESYVVTRT